MDLTLKKLSRTTAKIMHENQAVGHIGLMSGGTVAFVNLAYTFGLAFVAHANTLEDALAEAIKQLEKK